MIARLFIFVALGFALSAALADVDPKTFAKEIRALEWREIGPYRGGRSAAVAGIPSDRNTYYFGATGGGIWKTQDGGQSWRNVSDGYFGGSIGAVAVSEWDPNVIYAGGGEKTVRGNVSPGDGMWRSVDAGETWRRVGLTDSHHIPRIRIHPKDPDRVYAAVLGHLFGPNEQRGVYRSRDGGASWQRVLYVDENVGAVDLAMDPTNSRILYASTWRVRRTPHSLSSGGPGSGLYKSTDGGDTWVNLSENEGLPRGTLGIIGVAVSPTDNQNVYAIVEAEKGGVFRTRDGGKTWTKTSEDRNLRQRAWYYTRIYADPADAESVYVVNVRFHFSKDGGKTFTEIDTPHGDNHDLWIDPNDPLRMIEANDGGANVSYDRGATWSVQSNQPTAQMYRVSTDNAFPYRLLGGQQDNTAVRIRSRSAFGDQIDARDWEPTAGGESGHIAAKPDDPDIVVGGSYGGYLTLVDHRTGLRRSIDVWPDNPMGWGAGELKYRFQWNFPLQFSIHEPDRIFAAANVLFQSDDLGQSWTPISPDLSHNDKSKMQKSGGPITKDDTGVEYYGTIFALAESPHEPGVLWAGTDDGRVHVTRDGGANWAEVTPRRLPEWAQVNGIDAHPFEPGGAYLVATRYKLDDPAPYLYRTTDWGRSWTRITDGIPDDHFTRALRADPERQGLLYAGTERGIYYSLDDGASWQSLQLNLPRVPITDLQVKQGDLIAATQGRGFWILDDLSMLHQSDNAVRAEPVHLFTPRPAYRLAAGFERAEKTDSAGTNPHPGVAIYYHLAEEPAADVGVSVAVFAGDKDEPIWTWTRKPPPGTGEDEDEDEDEKKEKDDPNAPPDTEVLTAEAGLNRHVWNLAYPGMERFEDLVLWADMATGPLAVPGRYRARLKVGEVQQEADFEVWADPRSGATPADYQAQFDFIIEARDLLSHTHQEIKRIRTLRGQLETVGKRLEQNRSGAGDPSPLEAEIGSLSEILDTIEKALYQTQNKSRQDPLNYPIRLNNKLTALMRLVAIGDQAPTSQTLEVKRELTAAIEAQLAQLQTVWSDRVPALNRQIKDQGLDMLTAASPE